MGVFMFNHLVDDLYAGFSTDINYAREGRHPNEEIIMSTRFNRGTALITGASMGIGVVYADRLAKRGYNLILVARSEDKLKEVATQIQSATGRTVEAMRADLTSPADLRGVSERIYCDDSITALVNNAGVGSASKLIESDPNYLEQMIQLNVTALTRLALAATSSFPGRANGLIINIGSMLALVPELLNSAYSGTKAYVQNFSIGLRNELADKGVTVQLIMPGVTTTAIWDKMGLPIYDLPAEWVMTTEDMVDASLASLEQGEFPTIPSLPDFADFEAYDKARIALRPNLSRKNPADRYGVAARV
jgi:short-subunit dehydrogenase